MAGTVVFDIETHDASLLYDMQPEEFVRLIGYQIDDDTPVLTTDLKELRTVLLDARFIVGFNIHAFDLRAVFGTQSMIPVKLADQNRVFDLFVHTALVHQAPEQYINRLGKKALAKSPEQAKKWYSLDEQAYQLGVEGKTHDLSALAMEFGDPSLTPSERKRDGFGKIPVDDERFREYLLGDISATRNVGKALLQRGPLDAYAKREQRIAARAARISSNGFRVDREAAEARRDALRDRKQQVLNLLITEYGLPAKGKQPWRSDEGKDAIIKLLASYGITPETKEWTRTKGGALSLGGDTLKGLTKNTEAAELGEALAELMGQRSLSQLALDSMHSDGMVHADISMLQRSGRWSTTKPGLTVWTSRGPGRVEKEYFIPDNPDEVLVAFDYSNADSRIVAAYSGDIKYAERFLPGADGHLINAHAAWGADVVGNERDENGEFTGVTKEYRQKAKPLGHGWNYGGRAKTLSRESGLPLEDAKKFCDGMAREFRVLVGWQTQQSKIAQRGYITNDWGRRMLVTPGRAFTQGPALMGQSGTREIMCDAILRMPLPVLARIKVQVHDELIFSLPRENWEAWRDRIAEMMTDTFKPKMGGMRVQFPVSAGKPGENWLEATH